MRAGDLDRRATLQQRVLGTPSDRGAKPESFSDLATVWASRRDVVGREFLAAGQPHAEGTSIFELRFRSDLTPIHRVVCEGVTYDVLHVAELGRREKLQLTCRKLS